MLGALSGFFLGNQLARRPDGLEEIARLQSELSRLRLNRANASKARELTRPATRSTGSIASQQPLISEEELEAFKAFQEERARQAIDELVARTSAESASEYERLFSDLGLEEGTIRQVQSSLIDLHYKAVTAGDPLGELALARSAYDNNLRSLLSEDAYKRYRDYEKSKPARREYEMIKEYAAAKLGLSLDASQAEQIIALIKDAGATTTETWHGPYDPLPRPLAGAELVDQMQAEYLSLVNNANSLLTAVGESGMSEEDLQVLQQYYTDKTQAGYDKWVFWNRPIEDIRAEVRVRTVQEILDAQRAGSP
jgi:hypothetical protein